MTILDVQNIPYFADFGLVDLKDYIYKGIYETEVAFAKPKQTTDLEVIKELFSSVTKITIIQALFSPG